MPDLWNQSKDLIKIKLQWILEALEKKLVLYFTRGRSHKRTNHLSHRDIIKVYFKVRKGDVILAGNLKNPVSLVYSGPLTHSAIYVGRRKIVHAIEEGVGYATLHHFTTTYDTLVILRLPERIENRKHIIKKAIKFAREQVGKEYESFFKHEQSHFFCTELVNTAFHHAGHKTGLGNIKPFRSILEKVEKKIVEVEHWLRPEEFLRGKFKIVFLSHNLKLKGKKLILKEN